MAGSDVLPLTGERTVPGIAHENYWFRRHEAAYLWAADRWADVRGARVLEIGSGEGYGTDLFARRATTVLGVDYDAAAVAHAARAYRAASFVRGNLAALPVADASVDVVATLQVVEHVWDHAQFVAECRRVLRPDGHLLVTTPNRLTFSPGLDTPVNPFHTKEFTARELTGLLAAAGFEAHWVGGLHAGPRLQQLDVAYGGSFVEAQLATEPARWSSRLLADVTGVRAADFVARSDAESDVDASLDLVVLATPTGAPGGRTAGSAG